MSIIDLADNSDRRGLVHKIIRKVQIYDLESSHGFTGHIHIYLSICNW